MQSAFARFRADRSGNVALILGIAAIPLFAGAGLALDYAFAVRERSDLQNAVDAAALSLAKLPQNTSQADLEARAQAFVAAYMPNSAAQDFRISVTPSKGQLKIDASADYPTTIVKVLDLLTGDDSHSKLEIGTSATAAWGNGKVEVALVLDNTGSMKGTKLTNLKSAAKSLVTTLASQASEPGMVKIALVPFSSTVRLPVDKTDYKLSSWIDKDGKSPVAREIFNGTLNVKRFDLFRKLDDSTYQDLSWKGCVESRPMPYDVTDDTPDRDVPATLIVPYFAPDEPDTKKKNSNTGIYDNDYLGDNTSSGDFQTQQGNVGKYTALKNKDFDDGKGPNHGCGLEPIVPLTSDIGKSGAVTSGIGDMVADGNTNIPMGLAWGWYALSPNDMLSDNAPYSDEETAKVIVLMTDGDNTISGADPNADRNNPDRNGSNYSGIGYIWQDRVGIDDIKASDGERQDALDERLKKLCANIKAVRKKPGSTAPAIEIYTVLVELDSKATSRLLSDCATSSDMFYNVAKSADLVSVFNNIAGSIGRLHLSK